MQSGVYYDSRERIISKVTTMRHGPVPIFVTTNLKETRIFKVIKGKLPKRLEEIVDIPQAEDLTNAKKIKELLSQTKAFTRDEFSKLLSTCHNIIRNNDKLSPEAAFDEISKVLFIKIRYERDNTGTQIFSKEEFKNYGKRTTKPSQSKVCLFTSNCLSGRKRIMQKMTYSNRTIPFESKKQVSRLLSKS